MGRGTLGQAARSNLMGIVVAETLGETWGRSGRQRCSHGSPSPFSPRFVPPYIVCYLPCLEVVFFLLLTCLALTINLPVSKLVSTRILGEALLADYYHRDRHPAFQEVMVLQRRHQRMVQRSSQNMVQRRPQSSYSNVPQAQSTQSARREGIARAHYIIRVGNEGFAQRISDSAPNHWHYLSPQHLWGFPKGMTHVNVRSQFEADIANPRVTPYIWFLCNGHDGPGHFVQAAIGRPYVRHGPAENGPIPIPTYVMARLQEGFDHWFEWEPVSLSAAFQDRVRGLDIPRPTYVPTLRHVKTNHSHFATFEDLVNSPGGQAAPAVTPHAYQAPQSPVIQASQAPQSPVIQASQAPAVQSSKAPAIRLPASAPSTKVDLENVLREHTDPHGEGYVYLIQMSRTSFLKIGMSLEPDVRLRTLQTGNPYPLRLVKSWAVSDMLTVEASLHRLFEARKVENESVREWFDFSQSGEYEGEGHEDWVIGELDTAIAGLR